MLSRHSLPAIVLPAALRVVLRTRRLVKGQIRNVIVLLTVLAFTPFRMSASIQRPFPSLDQEVVGAVRAEDEVGLAVVGPVVVPMVDFLFSLQEAPERLFNYENVLEHISVAASARVFRTELRQVSVAVRSNATTPVRIALPKVPPRRVALPKEHGFALTLDPSSAVVIALGDWCRQPAATLTKTRSIYQSRAPIVCADSATNLTLSGGFRG